MPPHSPFRYRPIRDCDLPAAVRLMAQDRILFRTGTWSRILALLRQLLQRARLRGMVIEELGSGRLRFVGLSGFASLESLAPALPGGLFPPARVAAENAARNLHLVSLCACPDVVNVAEPEGYRVHRAMYDASVYLHRGYGLRALGWRRRFRRPWRIRKAWA